MKHFELVGEIPEFLKGIGYYLKYLIPNISTYIHYFDEWNLLCLVICFILAFILYFKYRKSKKINKLIMGLCVITFVLFGILSINVNDTCTVEYFEAKTVYTDNGSFVIDYIHYDYKLKDDDDFKLGKVVDINDNYVEIYYDDWSYAFLADMDNGIENQSGNIKMKYNTWIKYTAPDVIFSSGESTYRFYRFSK